MAFFLPCQSVTVSLGRVEETEETRKERRRRNTVVKMSPQQNENFEDY